MNRFVSPLLVILLAGFATMVPAHAADDSHAHHHHDASEVAATAESLAETLAYSANKAFLVRLQSVPVPIPYQKHFTVKLRVFDGKRISQTIDDATVGVNVGMRHGGRHFAHGMDSTPKVSFSKGILTVEGMYFTMRGPWTIELDIQHQKVRDVVSLELPCCGS